MRLAQMNDQPAATLEECLASLFASDVSKKTLGKTGALYKLASSSLQIITRFANNEEEYQHTYPVIRRMRKSAWHLPDGRLIYETSGTDQKRYRYHPNQFKPAGAIMRLDERAEDYRWSLSPDQGTPYYETSGNEMTDFIPTTDNVKYADPDERYLVFQYHHKADVRREHLIKVFYKKEESEWLTLYCVSIPLDLLAIILLEGSKEEE